MSDRLAISRVSASNVLLSGGIDVRNAAQILAQSGDIAASGTRVEVDLQGLETADSVTLAVLLAWAARAARQGGELVFTRIPPRLRAIAHLSKAEALLGVPDA